MASEQETGEAIIGAFTATLIFLGLLLQYWYIIVPVLALATVGAVVLARRRTARRR